MPVPLRFISLVTLKPRSSPPAHVSSRENDSEHVPLGAGALSACKCERIFQAHHLRRLTILTVLPQHFQAVANGHAAAVDAPHIHCKAQLDEISWPFPNAPSFHSTLRRSPTATLPLWMRPVTILPRNGCRSVITTRKENGSANGGRRELP